MLATETQTSLTFYGGKVGQLNFATRFTRIGLVKKEDFCATIALIYFVENQLDLP